MLKPGYEVCRSCKSESLFSGFFDEDGFAHTTGGSGHEADGKRETDYPWKTFCNDCGHDQDFYASGKPVRKPVKGVEGDSPEEAEKRRQGTARYRRHTRNWPGPTTGFTPSC